MAASRASLAEFAIRDGRRLTTCRARLDRMAPECDGGVTLHFEGLGASGVVELTAADIAEIAALAARAQAELEAWTAARKASD